MQRKAASPPRHSRPRILLQLLAEPALQLLVAVNQKLPYELRKSPRAFRIGDNLNLVARFALRLALVRAFFYQSPVVDRGETTRRTDGDVASLALDRQEDSSVSHTTGPELFRDERNVIFDFVVLIEAAFVCVVAVRRLDRLGRAHVGVQMDNGVEVVEELESGFGRGL